MFFPFSLFLFPPFSLPYVFPSFLFFSRISFSISQTSQYRHWLRSFTIYPFPPSSLLVPLFSLAVLPTPSSSAVFSPFQKPTFPGFTLQAEPRGASGTCVRAVGGLFNSPPPSPGYQLRHGARSRLIGCLSWRQEGGDPCRSSSDRDSHRFA